MHLTVFVPDLLWPDLENEAAFNFPGAATLAKVLALSTYSKTPMDKTGSWESVLAALFGFNPIRPPLAALRALGDQVQTTSIIACADPVNLNFIQQSLVLTPITADTLSDVETGALLKSLNEEFCGLGEFVAAPPRHNHCHWYFIPDARHGTSVLQDLAATSRLTGRRIDADETRQLLGREGLEWLNRIQMCLSQHPVNLCREADGRPTINSLWPWGPGQIEENPSARFSEATGDTALLQGLCKTTGTPFMQLQSLSIGETTGSISNHRLVTGLKIADAVSHDDLPKWQSAIAEMTANWIFPALSALSTKRGALTSLTLISPDAHNTHTWTLANTSPGIRGNFLQRYFGLPSKKTPSLSSIVRTW